MRDLDVPAMVKMMVTAAALTTTWACAGEEESATVQSMGGEAPSVAPGGSEAPPSREPEDVLQPAGFEGDLQLILDNLATELGPDQVRAFEEVPAIGGEQPYTALGLMAHMRQHLELAIWLYGRAVMADGEKPVPLNNLGVGLHEKYLLSPSGAASESDRRGDVILASSVSAVLPVSSDRQNELDPTLGLALQSLRRAVELDPDRAAFHNNLGYALYEIWQATGDETALDEAIVALRRALELDPKYVTAHAHLSQALIASGDQAGALAALARAEELNRRNGVMLVARRNLPGDARAAYDQRPRECNVDFRCSELCPKSIIGQLELVSCEMDQSSAQMACQRGEPFARAYDCATKIPDHGILIPGLHSGFTILTPWGRMDVIVQGDGRVDFKLKPSVSLGKGGAGAYLESQGSWSPQSGFSSVEFVAGFDYDLLGGDEASKMLNDLDIGPVSLSGEYNVTTGESEGKVEVYGGAVWSH